MVTFVEALGVCVWMFMIRVFGWGWGIRVAREREREAPGSSNLRVRGCLVGGGGSFTNTGIRGQSPGIFRLMCMVVVGARGASGLPGGAARSSTPRVRAYGVRGRGGPSP